MSPIHWSLGACFSILMVVSTGACRRPPTRDVIYSDPSSLVALVSDATKRSNEDYLIVDVRTAEEYATGHIPKAINIPYETVADQIHVSKSMPIILYCKRGVRSGKALKALEAKGYTNLTNFGGVDRWPSELER